MNHVSSLKSELRQAANPRQAKVCAWFFKTGKGEYGEGDKFLGIKNKVMRQITKKHEQIPAEKLISLLHSKKHEERQAVIMIWVRQFERGDEKTQQKIYNLYLRNTRWINNWDLVDGSAPKIAGAYLLNKPKEILFRLAKSENLWEKRIAIVATLAFIRQNRFIETFKISKILMADKHDLIHKAVGWMLREVGNRDRAAEEKFLRTYYSQMPRTMLRYAIEKFPEALRRDYLHGRV